MAMKLYELKNKASCIAATARGRSVMYRCKVDVNDFHDTGALVAPNGGRAFITPTKAGSSLNVHESYLDGGRKAQVGVTYEVAP